MANEQHKPGEEHEKTGEPLGVAHFAVNGRPPAV